ncbi:viral RNA helicase 1 [Segniliparus rotundus DSM 44985]|uniref:Viral RNA helicase 1 n=1 Tax=Segniliparus rotundus (strain ATCC BAA-972 / CDC 1076 / CIP 108378 / DSM 44985 / JCM 13578) TaxID=640132 RepID=D6ZF93_SEGRD|nr:ATP-binding domain-containing protein [Segniliparus rotundus]ADG97617.1 viral RNA helicase 1 [Segniliparus rotundus DSM 44985]
MSDEQQCCEDQDRLDVLYTRLDLLKATAERRLREALLAGDGDDQERSERESYVQLYSEDLAKYHAAEHNLCFGRLDMADGERRYIGRLGMFEDDSDEILLLDWRAPLSRPFYLATPAAPEDVVRRRHIRTRNRKVLTVNDETLDVSEAVGAEQSGGVVNEAALVAALGAARTGQMGDIVDTIQREQDLIIRNEHRGVIVVQGGPGTGKTAVALHRAAYLLYTHRTKLARSGVLIIGPNDTFLDYIGQVLPSLGETGVLLATVGTLFPGLQPTEEDSLQARAVKGSLGMVDVLKAAVRDYQRLPKNRIRIPFGRHELIVDRDLVSKAQGRARNSRRPHNPARQVFLRAAIDALADRLWRETEQEGSNDLDSYQDIRDELRSDPDVFEALGEFWPELDPHNVLRELYAQPERLSGLAPAEQAALARPSGAGFSPADAPLLDELAELIGTDDESAAEEARIKRAKAIAEAQAALDLVRDSGNEDPEDGFDSEVLMAHDLLDAEALADRHSHTSLASAAERAEADRTWAFGHVIVDEAQELSPMDWRMVFRRSPNRWMTLVGDVAQTGDPAGASSWADVLSPYVANRWRLAELTVNYRTPSEIMGLAADVLREINPEQTPPRSIRASGHVPFAVSVTADKIAATVADLTGGGEFTGLTAILAPSDEASSLRHLVSESVRVHTVHEVKGLEFDNVVLIEPADLVAESPRGHNDLYVALTRATQRLVVVHSKALPKTLASLAQRPALAG